MKKVIGFVVLVAIAVCLVTPFFLGMHAERKLNQVIAQLHNYPGYRAEVVAFDRGWLSSEVRINIGMDFPEEFFAAMEGTAFSALSLPLEITIQQGPVFYTDGTGLGWYRWQMVSANNNTDQPASQSPVYLHEGITTLSGQTRFTDKVSAFEKSIDDEDGNLNFGGYHGIGMIGRNGYMTYSGDIDTLAFTEAEVSINLQKLNLKMNADISQMDWELFVYPGDFVLSLAEINASINNGQGTQQINLQNFSMASSLKLPADSDWMSMDIQTAIASLNVNDWFLRDLRWDMAFDNISMDFYRAYHKANIEMFEAMDGAYTDMPPTLNFGKYFTPEVMQSFIEHGPAFRIDTLSATLPQGQFAASVGVNLKADTPTPPEPTNPMWLIGAIQAQANIEIDQALAHYLARLSTEPQVRIATMDNPDITEADIEQMIDMQVTTTLDMLIQQGMVISQGDVLTSQLQYNGGELTINGTLLPIPVGALLGGM